MDMPSMSRRPSLQRLPTAGTRAHSQALNLAQGSVPDGDLSGSDPRPNRSSTTRAAIISRLWWSVAADVSAGLVTQSFADAAGRARARCGRDRGRPRESAGRQRRTPVFRRTGEDPRRIASTPAMHGHCASCGSPLHGHLALAPYFDLANIVMLFLLTVVLVAVKFGRGPAVLAAFVSVASFDFFFVPPRFSLAVTRRAIPDHVRGHARGGADHRADDRGPALPGSRRRVTGRSAPRALYEFAREHVEPAADRTGRGGRDKLIAATFPREGGDPDSGRARSPA